MAESVWLAARFDAVKSAIDLRIGDSISEAWEAEPISTGAGMRLGSWGPGDCSDLVTQFENAVAWRFGWRRMAPTWFRGRYLGPVADSKAAAGNSARS